MFEGLDVSTGDLIAILDSDLSVDPETLIDFFKIVENGTADFVNGTRLIYGKEKGSMRFLNNIGNVIFQFLISVFFLFNSSFFFETNSKFSLLYLKALPCFKRKFLP